MYEQLTEFLPILGEVYGNWAEINVKRNCQMIRRL